MRATARLVRPSHRPSGLVHTQTWQATDGQLCPLQPPAQAISTHLSTDTQTAGKHGHHNAAKQGSRGLPGGPTCPSSPQTVYSPTSPGVAGAAYTLAEAQPRFVATRGSRDPRGVQRNTDKTLLI